MRHHLHTWGGTSRGLSFALSFFFHAWHSNQGKRKEEKEEEGEKGISWHVLVGCGWAFLGKPHPAPASCLEDCVCDQAVPPSPVCLLPSFTGPLLPNLTNKHGMHGISFIFSHVFHSIFLFRRRALLTR